MVCSDRELIREYLRQGSEAAFRELVTRHGRMLCATAARVTGAPDAAEEIVQTVFIRLAQKAPWLAGHESLAGWLHQATVLEARQWLRGETRRRQREQRAYEEASPMHDKPSLPAGLAGHLDEALLELPGRERQIVLLRHCEGHSYPEIARLLDLREDTVRKSCDRALVRLGEFVRKRGGATCGTAALLAGLDSASAALPATFAAQITHAALTAAPPALLGTIPLCVAKLLSMTKMQTAVLTAIIAAIPLAYEAGRWNAAGREHHDLNLRLAQAEDAYDAASRQLRRSQARLASAELRQNTLMMAPAAQTAPIATEPAWVDGAPYTRVPKSAISLVKPMGLNRSWKLTSTLKQLLALSPQENQTVDTALDTFTREIERQNTAHLKLLPATGTEPKQDGEETITYLIEERQEEAKAAARSLEQDILAALGPERGRTALRQFNLPLLPEGTTDYETHTSYNLNMNSGTASAQGFQWQITFSRNPLTKTPPQVSYEFKSPNSHATMRTGAIEFNHPSFPASLRTSWQQWKSAYTVAPTPHQHP